MKLTSKQRKTVAGEFRRAMTHLAPTEELFYACWCYARACCAAINKATDNGQPEVIFYTLFAPRHRCTYSYWWDRDITPYSYGCRVMALELAALLTEENNSAIYP